jgi:hypothetical protein
MEVRIYVEGGGDNKDTKAAIRRGFGTFLQELREQARLKRKRWNIIACGSRQQTYENFMLAQRTHPEAFNVLLVDSEVPVSSSPWEHLATRDGWETACLLDERYHLMVQIMESWFIADVESLKNFYGNGFNTKAIPKRREVEQIEKERLFSALASASRNTQKGEYQKIRHAAKLLESINPAIVKQVAPHCERLFSILRKKLQNCINLINN